MALINTAVGLLAISSPIGVLPVVAKAGGGDPRRISQISRMAVLTFLLTLWVACWWGQALLDLFAISLDSFRIAGGLILLPIGLRLIEGLEVSNPDGESAWDSLGVVPIGLPLLAGPGDLFGVVGFYAPAPGFGGVAGEGDQSADGSLAQCHCSADACKWLEGLFSCAELGWLRAEGLGDGPGTHSPWLVRV
jgi:multiple antibiotic resistance protein